jgi:hypothetical protein
VALADNSPQKKLVEEVSLLLHAEKPYEAARLVAEWVRQAGQKVPDPTTKSKAYEILNLLLHYCLNNNGMEDAARMLWGPTQFDPRPDSTHRVWKAFDEYNFILLMGAGSMSKSFSMAVRLFLEWIRDPEYTTVKVLGPSEQHLEDNLFTHLVTLHKNSTIPLPGEVGKLFIGLDKRSRKGSIAGVVIPLGKKAAGRLQGVKRSPRKTPHPVFGELSRLFIFLDEIANIPLGIFRDVDNLLSNTSGDGLKIVGAFNPTNQNDEVGLRCEPPFGWSSFDPDEHYQWMSTRGWFVVRLDAAQCENVLQGKVVYPGLQTLEGFNRIIQNSGGTNTPGYFAMARGCFPPLGTVLSIIPQGMLNDFKAEYIWYENPKPCGGVDLALEGGDAARFAAGKWGLATGIKIPPTLSFPDGRTVMFKNDKGKAYPKFALQLEKIFLLPKGDTIAMKDEIIRIAKTLGIQPEWLCVDRTGNGQGVFDLLKHEWGIGVTGVNYSEAPSETRIMAEDSDIAKKLYDRIASELWFALRKFMEFGYMRGHPSLETTELYPQMTGRLFRASGKFNKVEPKPDYRARHQGKSPDDADAVTLLVHAARKASGVILGMSAENTLAGDDDDGDYYGGDGVRIDITNRFCELDL